MTKTVTGNGIIRNGEEWNCSHCEYCDSDGRCVEYDHRPIWYTGCSGIKIGTDETLKDNFFYTGDLK